MAVALRDLSLASLRRVAVVWSACAVTVMIGVWLVFKARYYGLPLPVLPLAVGIPAWLAVTKRTGLALAVVLLYMGLLDGVVKLRTGGQAATLGRDVLLYAVAIGMAVRAPGPFRMPPLGGWVVTWTVVVLIQLANPHNSSMSHAFISLRQHLEFVPLFFIGFTALRTRGSLRTLFALLLFVAAINGPIAAYQGTLSPQQLASWGPGYATLLHGRDARIFKGSDGKLRVRPPGLGSDMGFSGGIGAIALPGGIALLMIYRRRRWPAALIVLGMTGAAIGVLTSQSRSDVITAIVAIVAAFGLMAVGRQGKRAFVAVCLAGALAVTAVTAIGSYDSGVFYRYRSIAPGSAASTIYDSRVGTWQLTPRYMRAFPFGAGLGSVGPAGDKLGQAAPTLNAESQFNFLVVETGIPGLFVFLAFQAALCVTVLTGLRRERDPQTVVLIAGLAAPLFGLAVFWLYGVTTTSTPDAPYLWLAAGVLSWWLVTRQRWAETSPRHG